MAGQLSTNRKCFTFTWTIENFEYCDKTTGHAVFSPPFIVDTIDRTKWTLCIFPRGEEIDTRISLFLQREDDCKGPATIEIDFELAFLEKGGSVLTSEYQIGIAFQKFSSSGFQLFESREFVTAKPSKFLPQGALTIRCRMWKRFGQVISDGLCIARTLIGVEKIAFFWKIPNFSTFFVGQDITLRLKATSDDMPITFLKCVLCRNGSSHSINIKFCNCNPSIKFSTFKASIVVSEGHYVHCGWYELWFTPTSQSAECKLPSSKEALTMNNRLYLPNNTLTLYCECAFSAGVLYEKIEETSYGCTGSLNTSYDSEYTKTVSAEKSDEDSKSFLKMDLTSMLLDNILCDVKLCSESKTFPAHWFILSARSPVFRAMFKSDMKEKARDRIDIKDLKPDTVHRMLLYMYTDSLEELSWEIASDLYVAAEKYLIMGMKDKCSSFLKTNISIANSCELLLLADLHQDKELKSIVQDFILENDKRIINSSEWNLLMETNVKLAAETLVLKYKK